MINWTDDKATMELETKIAQRAVVMAYSFNIKYKQLDAIMDIDACHSNGNPLKLEELLKADDANFAHDVFGIRTNIDRKTGKLMNCFVPRYSSVLQEVS
jgi:hypothetical protein